ncbi:type II and III secretion system protein [Methylomonas sp. EFPC3]|uniref:secretin N-terminal domain-containing protein n=1 Tax=Methylomonas sp. EFPC3 TaxID=3021710 RepID=UPI0024161488|nr:secretin N-terminal domain-containing protein [Methylomonas sp. EFPC3]WFP50025.1 type II and III secretion system protein [Methylomonas sp. EFPC3]
MKFKAAGLALAILAGQAALADEPVMEVIPLANRPASEILPLLAPLLDANDRVVDNGSSLIVRTHPDRLETIQSLVRKLDARLSNLVISVLQSSSKTAAELNAEAAIAVSPDAIRMRGMVGNTADLENRQQHQQLRTLEGQPAIIRTGEVRPVHQYNAYQYGYGASVYSNTQMVEATTGFAVTPRLVGRQVIIDVAPWSDRFRQNGQLDTQSAQTSIRANLGEWVEIAGNVDDENSRHSGFNSFNDATRHNQLRILVKVETTD